MLLREIAPPWREDLNLGLPGKGSWGLGGSTDTSELAAFGSTDALPAPPQCDRYVGFHSSAGLKPLSGALGPTRPPSLHAPAHTTTLCLLQCSAWVGVSSLLAPTYQPPLRPTCCHPPTGICQDLGLVHPAPAAHSPSAGIRCRPWQPSGAQWGLRAAALHTLAAATRHRPTAEE